MWSIIDERVSVRRDPAVDQALIRRLGRTINTRLKGERQQRMEEAGEEIERLLGAVDINGRVSDRIR